MWDAATIVVGSAIFALAFDWLFQPNQIVTGGVTGIGQVLHRLFPALPVGVVGIACNVPLFALLARRQGVRSCVRSFCAMVTGNVMIDLLDAVITFRPNQITALKQTVLAIDPGAFLIVCDAHEVIGEGFASYSEDAL